MYYIINNDKKIIATDSKFLDLLRVKTLQELFLQITNHKIIFHEKDINSLEITIDGESRVVSKSSHKLSTVIGDLTLIEIKEEIVALKEKRSEEYVMTIGENLSKSSEDRGSRLELLDGKEESKEDDSNTIENSKKRENGSSISIQQESIDRLKKQISDSLISKEREKPPKTMFITSENEIKTEVRKWQEKLR